MRYTRNAALWTPQTVATIDLQELPPRTVIYVYPLTGRPDKDVIPEGWEDVPGARGCTPESCGFRSHYDALRDNGVGEVFGLSTQSSVYQREARDRLHLPFEMLSDAEQELTNDLNFPMFTIEGVESLVEVPSLMIPDEFSRSEVSAEIPETLVRVSVGLEDADDLCEDLRKALP